LTAKFVALMAHMDERQRRLALGAEARLLGHKSNPSSCQGGGGAARCPRASPSWRFALTGQVGATPREARNPSWSPIRGWSFRCWAESSLIGGAIRARSCEYCQACARAAVRLAGQRQRSRGRRPCRPRSPVRLRQCSSVAHIDAGQRHLWPRPPLVSTACSCLSDVSRWVLQVGNMPCKCHRHPISCITPSSVDAPRRRALPDMMSEPLKGKAMT